MLKDKQNTRPDELVRRLAAIMFTDIVGYTSMMETHEDAAFKLLRRNHELHKLLINKYNGDYVKEMGDGILASFNSASEAVSCAVEIQQNASGEEIPLRIGIHEGEVLFEGNDVLGDAVNIASRIETFANEGGVLISDAVHDQIKNQPQWEFVPLGKFHLKNVNRTFEIYAVAAEGLAVPDPDLLKGKGEKIARFRTSIPIPATPLLGRHEEVEELIGLLKVNKVVTITGTGGIGKTRLALEVCNRLSSGYLNGIAFVSMATITDATEVIPTLAAALDIKEAENRDLIKGVAALVSDKKALIVLDNLEHVVSAAKEIADLAAMCPNLKILNTSRTPLKIKAEQEYPLHPLALPETGDAVSVDELMEYPAIALFADRAEKVNIDFKLTSENAADVLKICRRMDGLPLALELAAARIRILPPKVLVQRLERALDVLTIGAQDAPERHQTLRATIDWSHSLLNEAEQVLFRRLSVFRGGFTLDGIESVCYENEDTAFSALDELGSLLDEGLVEKIGEGDRYNMLQTINDYAAEQLKAAGETSEIQFRHAKYLFEIAKKTKDGIEGNDQLGWMKRGALEEANTQAALDYLLIRAKEGDEEAREIGLVICGDLYMYWHIRGKHISAKDIIESFFSATESKKPSIGKCWALSTTALASWILGKYEQAKEEALASYAIAKELGTEFELAAATSLLGFCYIFLDLDLAKKYLKEGENRCRKLGNSFFIGQILTMQGILNTIEGDSEKAEKKFSEALQLQRKIGDNEGGGLSLGGLAQLEAMAGNQERAIKLYQESLVSFEEVGDRPEEARILSEMAWTYLSLGNTVATRKYTLESIQAYQEVGSARGAGLAMLGLAAIESVEHHPERAIQIATAAEYFAKQEGIVNIYSEGFSGEAYIENAKKELSAEEIEKATKAGENLSLNEVLDLAEGHFIVVE